MREDNNDYQAFLTERRQYLLSAIAEACVRAGREPSEVTPLAVSKTVGPDEVLLAWRAGWRGFAENRPQELGRKLAAAAQAPEMEGVRFDLIGNLQKNKINQVVGNVALIHSVSSLELAQAISSRSERRGLVSDVLLEVNVSGEESKSGFSPELLREQVEDVVKETGIHVLGLMTMAPKGDADRARRTFSGLRELAEELRGRTGLALPELSCGMSNDFPLAVEEGATIVRLGRTCFDPNYQI